MIEISLRHALTQTTTWRLIFSVLPSGYLAYPGMGIDGGARNASGINGDACTALCASYVECQAYDFESAQGECYIHFATTKCNTILSKFWVYHMKKPPACRKFVGSSFSNYNNAVTLIRATKLCWLSSVTKNILAQTPTEMYMFYHAWTFFGSSKTENIWASKTQKQNFPAPTKFHTLPHWSFVP